MKGVLKLNPSCITVSCTFPNLVLTPTNPVPTVVMLDINVIKIINIIIPITIKISFFIFSYLPFRLLFPIQILNIYILLDVLFQSIFRF